MRSKIIKQKGDLLAALDIGSTKTCCFIARLENFKSNQGNFDLPKFGDVNSALISSGIASFFFAIFNQL